ncbi:hypothetical protein BC643_1192 [Mangrovibacterium diazotrophicum]|uniref:Uncharacterized protein n=1 Tax=Mangrovibacterium diazotrophicum TaxID=1261403 RepID=A0A419W5V8_9BACT|nr:hypothetical protein BC643_1192 [Mangrovibacterium diazotrophicum]
MLVLLIHNMLKNNLQTGKEMITNNKVNYTKTLGKNRLSDQV